MTQTHLVTTSIVWQPRGKGWIALYNIRAYPHAARRSERSVLATAVVVAMENSAGYRGRVQLDGVLVPPATRAEVTAATYHAAQAAAVAAAMDLARGLPALAADGLSWA